MAITKAKLIADGVITVDNLNASHGITTTHIGEGDNLYYTTDRVSSYLSTNNYITTAGGYFSDATLSANILTFLKSDGTTDSVDLSLYLDDTNLARLVSGTLDGQTGIATFTRDDSSTFTIDFSAFLADANDYVSSGNFNTTTGVLTLTRLGGGTVTVDLDGKYAEASHTHLWADITDRPTALSAFTNDLGNYGGFLTSFTETDPVYVASSWYTTTNNASNWNTAYGWGNHADGGYQAAATAITTSNISSQSVNYANTAGSTSYLSALGAYVWNASTNGRDFNQGIQTSFVSASESYPSFGSVVRVHTYPNDGGSAELYFPYSSTYGGSSMRYRLGQYDNAGWTGWKTVIDSDNIGSQSVSYATSAGSATDSSKLPLTGGTLSGTLVLGSVASAGSSAILNTNGFIRVSEHVLIHNPANLSMAQGISWDSSTNGLYTYTESTTGTLRATGSMRAPLFYDSDDTGYYLDPASTGLAAKVNGNIEVYARSASWAEGLRVRVPTTNTWGGIRWTRDRANNDGNWALGFKGSGDTSDDLVFWANNGGSDADKARIDKAGNLTVTTGVYSPIFYDSNDTSFYVNANGASRLHSVDSPQGYVSNGNPWGTSNSAYFPNGITTAGNTNWVYGNTYIGNAPSNGSGVEVSNVGRIYVRSENTSGTWGYAGLFIDRNYSSNNYVPFSFENEYGTHSWGTVARFHISNSVGDRPSIQFSHSANNTRWSIGYVYPDDDFRITQNHGYRPDNSTNDGWGTERFRVDTSGNVFSNVSSRSPIFYDSNDTGYYLDPHATSNLNVVQAKSIRNDGSVASDDGFGIYWNNAADADYAIYREPGGWAHPFPDLRIAFHTGIKLGANASYNGIRFYTDYDMATQVMSVNNSSDGYGAGHVHVNGIMHAGDSHRAPYFYDSNDTGYYVNPASTSNLAGLTVGSQITGSVSGYATYAKRIAGPDRINFTVGGNSSTFYPISIYTGAGATTNQYSEFVIERGGYDDPGYTGIGFSTFNARFTYKPSGWGYGATYFNLEQLTQTNVCLADYQDYYQASEAIIWLRGGTTYWIYSIVGGMTMNFSNPSGTNYAPTYNTFSPTTSISSRASYARYFDSSLYQSGAMLTGTNMQAPVFYDINDTGYYLDPNTTGICFRGAGSIQVNGDVTAYYSDMRLKTKVGNIENPIEKVKSLNGFYYIPNEIAESYGYKVERKVGVSAQEVQAVLPEAVKDAPIGDGYLTVQYDKIVPLLIEAIKEQQKQIEELKAIVNGITK